MITELKVSELIKLKSSASGGLMKHIDDSVELRSLVFWLGKN